MEVLLVELVQLPYPTRDSCEVLQAESVLEGLVDYLYGEATQRPLHGDLVPSLLHL